MKVTAHVMVSKGYELGIAASQWRSELMAECEKHNQEHFGEDEYLSHSMDRAVVTVEFEVPDSVFERPPALVVQGKTTSD